MVFSSKSWRVQISPPPPCVDERRARPPDVFVRPPFRGVPETFRHMRLTASLRGETNTLEHLPSWPNLHDMDIMCLLGALHTSPEHFAWVMFLSFFSGAFVNLTCVREFRQEVADSYAMDASSSMHSCFYRSGYDVSLPLAPKKHLRSLAEIAPLERAFFLTTKVNQRKRTLLPENVRIPNKYFGGLLGRTRQLS